VATSRARFAHRSEEDLAKLLDFYRIEWTYEPRRFPIAWGSGGIPVEFFTPDFYLPEYDLYVEVTVIKPKLQTRKNRKIRLLQLAHPNVRIKLLKRRDVLRLCERLAVAS
jgi:hypoxanthine phosphoribosyltransferase